MTVHRMCLLGNIQIVNWVGGISGCGLALIFTFPIFLVVENPFTKTILGLSTVLLTVAIAFFCNNAS